MNTLVVMRLADMGRVHPGQDNSRVCSKCGERVGIYPSGQRALRNFPAMPVVCFVCAQGVKGARSFPAAPWDEIKREVAASTERS
jgi:hypothetical protein